MSTFTDRDLPHPPLLAVEVLSPSTRRIDALLKRDRLQAAGGREGGVTGDLRHVALRPFPSPVGVAQQRPQLRSRRSGPSAVPGR